MRRVRPLSLLGLALPCLVACSGARATPGDDDPRPDASTSSDAPDVDAPPTSVDPVLNEIMRKPPDDATTMAEIHEFIEIHGAANTDYGDFAVLQIRGQGDPGEPGIIRTVHVLGTTDAGGLWATGYLEDQLKNNSETFLLVAGFTGQAGDDLDMNDDGTLDVQPWTRIVDAVALEDDTAEGPTHFKYTTVVLTPGMDGNADEYEGCSRKLDGVDTDATSDWVRNDPDGAGLPGMTGTAIAGEAVSTMGMPNQIIPSTTAAAAKINELVFNHASTDTSELIELKGMPSTALSGLTLVVLEGDAGAGGGAGVIDFVMAAGTTDANGYWQTGALPNMLENNTQTLLLVSGFTGAVGTDLDADDDGLLDAQPWTAIVDAIAVSDGGAADRTYAAAAVLPTTHGGGTLTVGGASRIPDGTDTDAPGDWVRNDFDGEGLLAGVTGTTMAGEALNTPGAANQVP